MSSTNAIYLGELVIAVITLVTTLWARLSAHKTDESNARLVAVGCTIDRVERKLDEHIRDHVRSRSFWDKD